MGPTIFCDDRLERLDVERLLRHDVFESAVLVLDLFQLLELTEFHAAVLRDHRTRVQNRTDNLA
jgi:hypothetical protein